jgi:hypothetical protein
MKGSTIMEVRTIKMEWDELDSLFENFFKEVLGKTIKCHVDFDDQTYWGVRFKDYEMPVVEVETVCYAVKANQAERKEAFPPDEGETHSRDFGLSIATKILSYHLGCTWQKIFADEDALYLIECTDIKA